MPRFVPTAALLALALAAVSNNAPARAESAAQAEAARQIARDEHRDRVTDAARDASVAGTPGNAAVVQDLNRERVSITPERPETRGVTPRTPAGSPVPLLGDNAQR